MNRRGFLMGAAAMVVAAPAARVVASSPLLAAPYGTGPAMTALPAMRAYQKAMVDMVTYGEGRLYQIGDLIEYRDRSRWQCVR